MSQQRVLSSIIKGLDKDSTRLFTPIEEDHRLQILFVIESLKTVLLVTVIYSLQDSLKSIRGTFVAGNLTFMEKELSKEGDPSSWFLSLLHPHHHLEQEVILLGVSLDRRAGRRSDVSSWTRQYFSSLSQNNWTHLVCLTHTDRNRGYSWSFNYRTSVSSCIELERTREESKGKRMKQKT